MVDSGIIKKYITPKVIKRLKIPYREKKILYILVIISG